MEPSYFYDKESAMLAKYKIYAEYRSTGQLGADF